MTPLTALGKAEPATLHVTRTTALRAPIQLAQRTTPFVDTKKLNE